MWVSWLVTALWLSTTCKVSSFAPSRSFLSPKTRVSCIGGLSPHVRLYSKDADEEEEPENPYADPNYPDLEFVNYSDPEYVVDQGGEDVFDEDQTEEQIEAMREERRRRNDEFQFETYFKDILKKGDEFKGEWTIYRTNFDELDPNGFPRFVKDRHTLKVVSKGSKVIVDPNAKWRVDGEHICHEEVAVSKDTSQTSNDSTEKDSPQAELDQIVANAKKTEKEIMANTYWPDQLTSGDMRGQQGNMCVGNAYTICTAVPIEKGAPHEGPFCELRTEVGILSDQMRFRVKFDYRVDDNAEGDSPPPLNLRSMTVCRETRDSWPRESSIPVEGALQVSEALFGAPGASGGLYDPPPVGCEKQSGRYILLDLEGGATVLFPFMMDQNAEAFEGNGWVTSLDWTPGTIRYQVDRKVHGGKGLMGLRTLELSEVQGADADTYRPRDGGQNMRQ